MTKGQLTRRQTGFVTETDFEDRFKLAENTYMVGRIEFKDQNMAKKFIEAAGIGNQDATDKRIVTFTWREEGVDLSGFIW